MRVPLRDITLQQLPTAQSQKITNTLFGPDWYYADLKYDHYFYPQSDRLKLATVYYGVMAMEFPRTLPNMFFDSKKARGKQFRAVFDQRQIIGLEEDFENYFTTYFPMKYTVDALSIITPEVMLALEAASDYDIEIFDNRLILYGPLYDPELQISDMLAKVTPLKEKLLHNVSTYRDVRVKSGQGRVRVAPEGRQLLLSPFPIWMYVTPIIAIAILCWYLRRHG